MCVVRISLITFVEISQRQIFLITKAGMYTTVELSLLDISTLDSEKPIIWDFVKLMYMMILMVCTINIHGDLPLMLCKWLGFGETGYQVTFSVVVLNIPLLLAKSGELYISRYLCNLIFSLRTKLETIDFLFFKIKPP